MAISFFVEGITFKIPEQRKTARWIKSIIEQHHHTTGDLNYILADDEYLLRINQQYLNHDFYTDIITFDQSEEGGKDISGDIYISVERIRDNSLKHEQSFEQEFKRVIIHGVLHLLGFNDQTPEEKDKMRKKEDAFLSLYD